jgi:hypothetical protein
MNTKENLVINYEIGLTAIVTLLKSTKLTLFVPRETIKQMIETTSFEAFMKTNSMILKYSKNNKEVKAHVKISRKTLLLHDCSVDTFTLQDIKDADGLVFTVKLMNIGDKLTLNKMFDIWQRV